MRLDTLAPVWLWGTVLATLRAKDDRCSSWVGTTIAGVPARVGGVFVRQKLLGVDYVLLSGWSEDGRAVRERISL